MVVHLWIPQNVSPFKVSLNLDQKNFYNSYLVFVIFIENFHKNYSYLLSLFAYLLPDISNIMKNMLSNKLNLLFSADK